MWNHLKTILIVTGVSLLIWLYAEAETLSTIEIPVEVQIAAPRDSQRIVDVTDEDFLAGSRKVTITLRGAAAAVTRLEQSLGRGIRVELSPDELDDAPAQLDLDLRDAIRRSLSVRDQSPLIQKCSPANVKVATDVLITKELPVKIESPWGETDGVPEASPATVRITAPGKIAEAFAPDAAVIARIDEPTWNQLLPGKRETIRGVRLTAPNGAGWTIGTGQNARVTASPPTVDLTLTVRSRISTARLADPVPVHVRIAPGELDGWKIEIPERDRVLTDVTVSGPADLVRQVTDKAITLRAYVSLSFEELERGITSKEAVFSDLPSPLRVEAPNRTIRLKITRREVPAGG